jgi:L-lactate dehydrogenase (cytochrome)
MATKPAWILSMLKSKSRTFGNLAGHVKGMQDVKSLAEWTATQFDQALSWNDIEWVKGQWPGKLILKGILDIQDAKLAVKSGADAIVVSNHGGRQLDGASSSISILPAIVDAVGSGIETMFDGGIRTGMDIMRALALGAKICLVGRSYAWGVGAGGKEGATKAIDILAKELDVTMALCGYKRVVDVDRHAVERFSHGQPPGTWT